jgi:hypothetical protein
MTLRLVLRGLVARPVRFAVLACGFGFGIAVMAALLGVGDVVLEQAKNPALAGGGEVTITGGGGTVEHARFVLASIVEADPIAQRVEVASPAARDTLYLVQGNEITPLRATGGIPSREKAIGDPEAASAAWTDTDADRAWIAPDPTDLLRGIDRFHPIPDVPARADSWAEWWYFNGRSGDGASRFYLTFLAGPRGRDGLRSSFVRIQLTRGGNTVNYLSVADVDESTLPDGNGTIAIGESRAVLRDGRYTIDLDLEREGGGQRLRGRMTLEASPRRSVPPLTLQGAGGWVSGYVVPVLSGKLDGSLAIGTEVVSLDGFVGYHDHNWGFWSGVTWQWGQVAHEGLSFVYGRIRPPADAADPNRVPAVVAVIGPEGPLGIASEARIVEDDAPGLGRPERIRIEARGAGLSIDLDLHVEDAIRTRTARTASAKGAAPTFLQMRGRYRVKGEISGKAIDFEAPGSAETFRTE